VARTRPQLRLGSPRAGGGRIGGGGEALAHRPSPLQLIHRPRFSIAHGPDRPCKKCPLRRDSNVSNRNHETEGDDVMTGSNRAPRAVTDGDTILVTADVGALPQRIFDAVTTEEVERW
jgi:hypothetical protein